jgi:hypothetical protein
MPNRSHGRNRPHPIPAQRAFGASQPGASDDGVCIATLRRAKFDIGIRSSKDENQVPGGGLCRLRMMSTLRVTQARCSN